MRILIDDAVQYSDAVESLKSPSLADITASTGFTIALATTRTIDCIGIGNTDATQVTVNGQLLQLDIVNKISDRNGLYLLPISIDASTLEVTHNGSFVGRFAAGKNRTICVSPAREPGYGSTHQIRDTVGGQAMGGAGGYTYRSIQVDARYKFTSEILSDINDAYDSQIGRGYPFFLWFKEEVNIIPFIRLYGKEKSANITFQSSVNKSLYSRKMNFKESF